MNVLRQLAEVNPALIITSVIAAYALLYFLRHNAGYVVMAAWVGLTVSLFALPGGQEVLTRASELPLVADKGQCLANAVREGAPWSSAREARRVRACRFRGVGVGPALGTTQAAQESTDAAGAALVKLYGGRVAR